MLKMSGSYAPVEDSADELSVHSGNDNEIDLEKGLLPKCNTGNGGTTPCSEPPHYDSDAVVEMDMYENNIYMQTFKLRPFPKSGVTNFSNVVFQMKTYENNRHMQTFRLRPFAKNGVTNGVKLAQVLFLLLPFNFIFIACLFFRKASFTDFSLMGWILFGIWCLTCFLSSFILYAYHESWTKFARERPDDFSLILFGLLFPGIVTMVVFYGLYMNSIYG
uniref:Wtf7 n=1 Tax=Schizosaccharomyces pombe TaxID=4896 RepID=A0A482AS05_SCHPM|nr:Wtf7 [Schizosaccharomyces pombe]QBL54489.1 Wtf7 [Schizosaccharomyces pombe]QBL54493.1 Wtf7 [Schizosaccharomyces pombe]